MKLLVATFLLSLATTPVLAADHATSECSRIVDVDVPFDVDVGADALRFEGGQAPVVVTAERIQVGARSFSDVSVREYHDDLRGFLDNAGSMARVARKFLSRGDFPQAASDMCQAILAVQASGQVVEQRFPGFTNPVRVTLK